MASHRRFAAARRRVVASHRRFAVERTADFTCPRGLFGMGIWEAQSERW
jgi:hypothetical protein